MNAEKAAYSSKAFAQKRQRTLDALLKSYEEQYRSSEVMCQLLTGQEEHVLLCCLYVDFVYCMHKVDCCMLPLILAVLFLVLFPE